MKIKALKTMRGDSGMIRRDAEVEINDGMAKSLIKRGLAVEVAAKAKPKGDAPKKGE